jgi:N-acetylneuraminic acid mutarotase
VLLAKSAAAGPAAPRRRGWHWRIGLLAVGGLVVLLAPLAYLTLSPKKPAGWVTRKPLTVARAKHAGAVVDGKIYVVGGTTVGDSLRTVEIYDPETDDWQPGEPFPPVEEGDLGRYSFSAAVLGGEIYLPGGWCRKPAMPVKTLLVYNPLQNAWNTGTPLPMPEEQGAGNTVAVTLGDKLYLFVGERGLPATATIFLVLDGLKKGKWSELPMPEIAFNDRGGAGIGGKFYLVGGRRVETHDGKGEQITNRLDVFDPATGQWAKKMPMPTPRSNPAVVVVNGKLCALGGYDLDHRLLAQVECYDPATDQWSPGWPLPQPRGHAYAAVIGPTVYLVGGVTAHHGKHLYLSAVEAIAADELLTPP